MTAAKLETLTVQEALVALQAERTQPAALPSDMTEAGAERGFPKQTIDTRDDQEMIHYVVWEVELGARIYKVPHGKLASLRSQPHADRFKVFDDLAAAKVEALEVFQKVAEKRAEQMLPPSILEPILADIKRSSEHDIPNYFL